MTISNIKGYPMKKPKAEASTIVEFENNLKELSSIIEKLEKGSLSLDESLALFEKGIHLTRNCHQSLKEAEQKVEILLAKVIDNSSEEV